MQDQAKNPTIITSSWLYQTLCNVRVIINFFTQLFLQYKMYKIQWYPCNLSAADSDLCSNAVQYFYFFVLQLYYNQSGVTRSLEFNGNFSWFFPCTLVYKHGILETYFWYLDNVKYSYFSTVKLTGCCKQLRWVEPVCTSSQPTGS